MERWVGFLLIALAAGLRSKSDLAWPWEEHPASSPEELQELLSTVLAQTNAAEATKEGPGDAEAQERTLRERIARIRKDWQSPSATACHQQLGRLMNSLTLECGGLQPKADWLLDYYVPALPNKTCDESVSDIFALGDELVETLRISRDAVASLDVAGETLRRYQALSFLRSWLVKLTETHDRALLWAGFWDGDPENHTTMTKLSNFAKAIEHATVHPDSFLGQAIDTSQNLDACFEDPQTSALAGNMWSIASMTFVLGMRERAQGTVIALVNKQITGERNLSESVLSTHEIPTVGLAAWGLGFWSPEVLVVDLMGTCYKTSPALQKRLLARLPFWAKSMTNWSPEAFAMRSRLQWQCIDCSGACSLDEAFAEHVEKLVEVVSPQLAARAVTKLSEEEVGLKLRRSWDKPSGPSRPRALMKLYSYREVLEKEVLSVMKVVRLKKLAKAGRLKKLAGPARLSRVRELLHQNADPNVGDEFGSTTLMSAAYEGDLELVQALLDAGAKLEARNEVGSTALIYAASKGYLKVVEALVESRAQLETRNQRGSTALMSAASNGHMQVVEALAKAGAQLETRNEQGTVLTWAATHGRLEVVEALVDLGAQLEACDADGKTALICAAERGNLGVVEALVKAGAQLEARSEQGFTALMSASKNGHLWVVEALLTAGAQPQARDVAGKTAFDYAREHGPFFQEFLKHLTG